VAAIPFRNQESSYLAWIGANPSGLVLTTTSTPVAEYMSLHRATCQMISKRMKSMSRGAFTERRYMKVCATSTAELLDWVRTQGGTDFTKSCSRCQPQLINAKVDQVRAFQIQFASFEQRLSWPKSTSSFRVKEAINSNRVGSCVRSKSRCRRRGAR